MAPPLNPDTNMAEKRKATDTGSGSATTVDRPPDRINSMPDSILCTILTLLNLHDAGRMSVVSRTWRTLYTSPEYQPDSIDDDGDLWLGGHHPPRGATQWSAQPRWRSDAITASLAAHGGSVKRFAVRWTRPFGDALRTWIRTLSERGVVEEIVLEKPCLPRLALPHAILGCSSLRSLSLCNCAWPSFAAGTPAPAAWTLPRLTELTLRKMTMAVADVEDLLGRCPALLSLAICMCNPRRSGSLRIVCENLVSLTIVELKMRVESRGNWNVPKLERLLWWTPGNIYDEDWSLEEWMPRVHTLGVFSGLDVGVSDMPMKQVTTLAICTDLDGDIGEVEAGNTICMLRSLPYLETLHLQLTSGSVEVRRRNGKKIGAYANSYEEIVEGPVTCPALENSLKTIVLRVPYLAHSVELRLAFANFLLGAAEALKVMYIACKEMSGELLPPEDRGSVDARVVFLQNSECSIQLSMAASNFKLADPFVPQGLPDLSE